MERVIWALAILIASAATGYSCILLSNRFRTSLISTVFESTTFKVSQIPFAGVSVCNNNRFNYNKTDDAFAKFVPNGSKAEKETFVKFIHIFQNVEWGSYDEFEVMQGDDITKLKAIRIVELYDFMMLNCEDFFVSCWWKNVPFKCCNWFSKQRTEYGICWSFNTFTSVGSKFVNRSSNFPWRIQGNGPKSALKVIINTHPEASIDRSPIANSNPGVMVMVQHPHEWPGIGSYIAAGSVTALKIRPTVFSTSEDVSGLSPKDRQCNYYYEAEEHNLTHLKGLPYMKANCMAECRQSYTVKFCNCSVAFLHPAVDYPECDVNGILCLIKYNDFLNAEKPLTKNPFFDDNGDGLECRCLPECSRIDYKIDASPIYDEKRVAENIAVLDIHYGSTTMMKYRTDLTFSGMDLLVGFGGIVSLFLGCSVLSGAEIVYFSTVALFWHRKRSKSTRDEEGKIKARFPFLQ